MCADNRSTGPEGFAARAILLLIRAYKLCFSPLFAGSCRFVPSCADYMAEAVRQRGAALGVGLGLARLARCHPLCAPGFDPVPVEKHAGVRWSVLGERLWCRIGGSKG